MRNSIWPASKNNSVAKNNKSSPAAGVRNATTGNTTLGGGSAAFMAVGAEQRVFQFVQRGERLIEHCELFLDARPDLGRAADPVSDRPGQRRDDEAERAERENENEDAVIQGGMP